MIVLRALADDVKEHFWSRAWEWGLACVMIGTGFQLVRDGQTLSSSYLYAVLRWVGDDDTWGTVATVLGWGRFIALFLNGTFRCFRRVSPVIRSATALLSAIFWFATFAGFALVNPHAYTLPALIGIILAELILSAHIATEAGRAQKKPK